MTDKLIIKDFYDEATFTYSYVITDSQSGECAVIDPVLDYDMISGRVNEKSVTEIIRYIEENKWQLKWILETHAHADHLTAAQQLKQACGGEICIGHGIIDIQKQFKTVYGFGEEFDTGGTAFDCLLNEGDTLMLGDCEIVVLATPGHTLDSLTYHVDNYLFIGDTMFHPDTGTARCDFPGGDAELLFQSIQRILSFNGDTKLCLCHDYPGPTRNPQTYITVKEMKSNIHLIKSDNTVDKFVRIRHARDSSLSLPKLIIPSIQVNCQAGLKLNDKLRTLLWPINRF